MVMSNKKVDNCCICGGELDYDNGSAALMLAFCYNHAITLTNVSFCGECYKRFIQKPLAMMSEGAGMNIPTGEDET